MAEQLSVTEETTWTAAEAALFDNPLLDNVAHFLPASRRSTRLTLAKVRRGQELLGVAPVLVLRRYRGTRLLRPDLRARLDRPLGRLSAMTQCLLDTTFLGFAHEAPFLARDPAELPAARAAIIGHLKARRDIAAIGITEPAADPATLRQAGFDSFLQLPLMVAETAGCADLEAYLARQTPKRRRNMRSEMKLLADAGGRVRIHPPGQDRALVDRMHALLIQSAQRNAGLEVPHALLLNDYGSFRAQRQWAITVELGGQVIGFFSFLPHRGVMHQLHGGLDYAAGPAVKLYPNLMHAAVVHAIATGARAVSFGPLNNEAKRRVGVEYPVMSSLWVRNPLKRWFSRNWMVPRLDVWRGPMPEGPIIASPLYEGRPRVPL